MRVHFLRFTAKDFDTDSASYELFLKALGKMDEAEKKEPFSAKNLLPLGIAYDQKASITKDKADWKKAEGYYRRALELAPLRQEVVYALAADLVYQGRANEAVDLMRKELAADDRPAETHYYLGFVISKQGENKYAEALTEMEKGLTYFMYKEFYPANSGAVYKRLARYFYGVQDQPNFITVMKRLSLINPQDKATNAAIIKSVEGGSWPEMEIK
jgi:tetratricopeptide (TPR) repeat protein